MTTIHRDREGLFEPLELDDAADRTDLAGGPIPLAAWRAFYGSYRRVVERYEDQQIALLVRERDLLDTGERLTIDEFLEGRGFNIAELEAEIDAEDG